MMSRVRLGCIVVLLSCGSVADPGAADRSGPPRLGPPPRVEIPEIVAFKTGNGLAVHLVPDRRLPIVQLTWVFNGGSTSDPAGKAGLASFTADMLDEGAGGLSALELADQVQHLGVWLDSEAERESNQLSLFTSRRLLEPALALVAKLLTAPAFPSEEIERIRTIRMTDYLQRYDEPREIAVEQFLRAVFGADHPMARSGGGYPQSIRAISRQDLLDYHDRYYRPRNGFLVAAGDIDREELSAMLERHFSQWRGGKWLERPLPEPEPTDGIQVFLVDRPGAVQSHIRIGRPSIGRRHPDFYPLMVMNTVLGGTAQARLNQNIRVRNGYAYGAYSGNPALRDIGLFWAVSNVQNDATGKAILEFFNEFNGMGEPVPAVELRRVQDYLVYGYPFQFTTLQRVADNVLRKVLYHHDDDVFATHVPKIRAVTAGDISRIARNVVTPEHMSVVVVGAADEILPEIEALDLGRLTVLSIEEVLGPRPQLE